MKLLFVAWSLALGSAVSTAGTFWQECQQQVDSQHSCACNDIRGVENEDVGAFDPNRSDIAHAIEGLTQNPAYQFAPPSDQPRLKQEWMSRLEQTYEQQRDLLACHDRVALRLSDFIFAQSYCVHEIDAAISQRKPFCSSVENGPIEQAKTQVRAMQERLLGTWTQQLDRLSFCDPSQIQPIQKTRGIAVQSPPCKIDLKSLFPDNTSQLSPGQIQKLIQHIETHECYQQAAQNQLELQKIEIASSSSRLANTGIASKKSFLDLSRERAFEIRSKIVQPLLRALGQTHRQRTSLESVPLELSYLGQNQDGTSGACPYAYDALKKTWFRKTFPSAEQLEPNKKTELNFYFGERTKPVQTSYRSDVMAISCKRVSFYCR